MTPQVLSTLFRESENYEAHIIKDKKGRIIKREKLLEHTELTFQYFQFLWKEKGIEEMLKRFCGELWGGLSGEGYAYLQSLLFGIPIFHDSGKVNPAFQIQKMENGKLREAGQFERVGSRHSIVSAVLYIDYFRSSIRASVTDKNERELLKPFILLHAFLIERHHSDLSSLQQFFTSLKEEQGQTVIRIFENGGFDGYTKDFRCSAKSIQEAIRNCEKMLENLTRKQSIFLYAYEKLLYSLLVASDYYATAEFMSQIKIRKIGNLNDFSEWMEIYENTELMKTVREYQAKVFPKKAEELAATKDINVLRKEILCETEQEIKKNCDRQFLNDPMILSTHVSLFDTMFGNTKESAFGFHQLMDSVVVLDEIQSYRNEIWGEMIVFLKEISRLLNMKIIIMSATLPNLDVLSGESNPAVQLVKNRGKYFSHPCFRNRVKISYELLEKEDIERVLTEQIAGKIQEGKKVLVEFIKKDTAKQFFEKLKEEKGLSCEIEYLSGDDSLLERKRILRKIKSSKGPIILIATQVVEAGVDIDMDVGYKNISKLDSEEQFLGRINRSCIRSGEVYFFKMDDGKGIYEKDIRITKEFTLENQKMRDVLSTKEFSGYYEKVMEVIRRHYNERVKEGGLEYFFKEQVGKLNFPEVGNTMWLIKENDWCMQVYLGRTLTTEEGTVIDGAKIWRQYVELLKDFSMDYAEKRVKLSTLRSQMNGFLYQIKKNPDLVYNEKIGDIFYIEDGEKYFEDGKLNRKKV